MRVISGCAIAIVGLLSVAPVSFAEQTQKEQSNATKHEIKRDANKAINRVDEATCMKGDAQCAAEKAKHRLEETGDSAKDKLEETKDKVD